MGKLEAALAWAARGYRVFPCVPNAKRPLLEDWPALATTDENTIRAWWFQHPDANIGMAGTGLVVLDLDEKNGRTGVQDFYNLGLDFDTLTVATPSGGYHVYYAGPPTANSAGKLGHGIDTRGPGGYVLAPGSSIDGAEYAIVYDKPVASVPPSVMAQLEAPRSRATQEQAVPELDSPGAIAAAVGFLESAPLAIEGSFGDNTTYRVCCEVRDLGISESMALDLMLEHWNDRCSPPWSVEELRTKVDSTYRHAQNPAGAKAAEALFNGIVVEPPQYEAVERSSVPGAIFGNLIPANALAPRRWVMRRALLRGDVTLIDAPGGTAKSTFILTQIAHLVQGLDFLDWSNVAGPCKAVVYNAEDSLEELSMRLHAICKFYNFDPEVVSSRIALISGRGDSRLKLTSGTGGRGDPVLGIEASMRMLVEIVANNPEVAVISLDPLAKLHSAPENDNAAMSAVMDVIDAVTTAADVATLIAQHTAKARDAQGGRGASSITDSARISFSLRGPTEEDVYLYGIEASEKNRFVRLDDGKMNRSLQKVTPTWLEKHSVILENGESIGVVKHTDMVERGAVLRRAMAYTLMVEMTAGGKSFVPLTDAVRMLQRVDGVWGALELASAKLRVQRMLEQPVELEDGRLISMRIESHKKLVVLS